MANELILAVDDETHILELLSFNLEASGYRVVTAATGEDALVVCANERPAMVLLDIMLPGIDGMEVCRRLKSAPTTADIPIIMLTAKGDEVDKILGLELGADDYITKPFDPKEMTARVKAVLRRTQGAEEEKNTDLAFPGLTISITEYSVRYDGHNVEMPPKELEVLYFLASHANQVFTREPLRKQVWGYDFFGDSRTVDVHIKRLREKLTDSERYGWDLHTVRGVGYKFELK